MSKMYTESMEVLMACAAACKNCVSVCINDGKPLSCCPLCIDCADVCMLAFRLEANNSAYLKEICRVVADVCDACAEECEKHTGYHAHCKNCAEACRKCAEMCRSKLS